MKIYSPSKKADISILLSEMEHVAIMTPTWNMIPKILEGAKTIESRWFMNKSKPWDIVQKGDIIYFKNTGGPVILKATVTNVEQYICNSPEEIQKLLNTYYIPDGIEESDISNFFERFKNKRYAIFIHITNPQIVEPFKINKKGFGSMAAWISLADISAIRIP